MGDNETIDECDTVRVNEINRSSNNILRGSTKILDDEQLIVDQRYERLEELGSGGMGTVYRARSLDSGTECAIKILDKTFTRDHRDRERFVREVTLMHRLDNPHVVKIHDWGPIHPNSCEDPYLVMELLRGEDLLKLVERKKYLTPQRAVTIISDVCAGLHAAHSAGIVHRDIKPSNCFCVQQQGRSDFVKILDFGIASLENVGSSTSSPLGTLGYMAPERFNGGVHYRGVDIYSVGVLAHVLLTGREPPREHPKRLTAEHLTREVCSVIERATAIRPEERFASVLELSTALRHAVGQPEVTSEPLTILKAPDGSYDILATVANLFRNPPPHLDMQFVRDEFGELERTYSRRDLRLRAEQANYTLHSYPHLIDTEVGELLPKISIADSIGRNFFYCPRGRRFAPRFSIEVTKGPRLTLCRGEARGGHPLEFIIPT